MVAEETWPDPSIPNRWRDCGQLQPIPSYILISSESSPRVNCSQSGPHRGTQVSSRTCPQGTARCGQRLQLVSGPPFPPWRGGGRKEIDTKPSLYSSQLGLLSPDSQLSTQSSETFHQYYHFYTYDVLYFIIDH